MPSLFFFRCLAVFSFPFHYWEVQQCCSTSQRYVNGSIMRRRFKIDSARCRWKKVFKRPNALFALTSQLKVTIPRKRCLPCTRTELIVRSLHQVQLFCSSIVFNYSFECLCRRRLRKVRLDLKVRRTAQRSLDILFSPKESRHFSRSHYSRQSIWKNIIAPITNWSFIRSRSKAPSKKNHVYEL